MVRSNNASSSLKMGKPSRGGVGSSTVKKNHLPKSRPHSRNAPNISASAASVEVLDLTDLPDSTTNSLLTPIPSLQCTKQIRTQITELRNGLERARQNRARLDRTLWELSILQDKSNAVIETSIWKHVIAQAHLRILAGDEGVKHGNLIISQCYIGIIASPLPPFQYFDRDLSWLSLDRATYRLGNCCHCKKPLGENLRLATCCLPLAEQSNVDIQWHHL